MKVRIGFAIGGQRVLDLDEYGAVLDDLERLGFDSVWLPETFLGGTFDPLVGLAFAAARVARLKLGTHLVAPGRNPIALAKSLANLDRLSHGRLLLTFVPGLPETAERAAQGLLEGDRRTWFDDNLPVLRRLWAGDEVEGASISPRPYQDPLEVWLGGRTSAALERVGRLGDGWLPGLITIDDAIAGRRVVDRVAAAAGRVISPEHFGINLSYSLRDVSASEMPPARTSGDPRDIVAIGVPALRDLMTRWIDAGFSKFVVRPLVKPVVWRTELEELAAAVLDLQT
jgi:probable F420-dependent oxidoreductase